MSQYSTYFDYAVFYGQTLISDHLDACEAAADAFHAAHKNQKDWKTDWFACLVGHGVGLFFKPLSGPAGKLTGLLKATVDKASKDLQSAIVGELKQSLSAGNQKSAADAMHKVMKNGLSASRDFFREQMNDLLQPLLSRCNQLSSGPDANVIANQNRVEAWVKEILPCGHVNSIKVKTTLEQDLETIWRQYVRQQQTVVQTLASCSELTTRRTFIPIGRWDHQIRFKPLSMSSGLGEWLGLKNAHLVAVDDFAKHGGSWRVPYDFEVVYSLPGTSLRMPPIEMEGYFRIFYRLDIKKVPTLEAYKEYVKEQNRVRTLWARLMSHGRPQIRPVSH